jgi:putative heme-binding domain-containing protein
LLDGSETKPHPFLGDPQAIAAGAQQFSTGCAACHGSDGKGGRGPNLHERLRSDELTDEVLQTVIQKGLPGMPGANLSADRTWQLIAFLRSLTSPAAATKVPGDPEAGSRIFWSGAGCSGCHAIAGNGGRLGPDLTNIGGNRTLTQLRDAVLQPDANPVAGYLSAVAVLKDGSTLRGVARNRTNYSLQLQDNSGTLHLLRMDSIRQLTISKRSPMPDDYGKRLTPDQLQDLLSFLARQSVRPAGK